MTSELEFLNTDATRRAPPDAGLSTADELMQRLMAQYGLAALGRSIDAADLSAMPSVNDPLSKHGAATQSPAAIPNIPAGAEFSSNTFTCMAGGRDFRTYIPASATEGGSGLLVMLHSCTKSPKTMALAAVRLRDLAQIPIARTRARKCSIFQQPTQNA